VRDVEVLDIEVTEDGPVVDVIDIAKPVRLLVREWIDERHCRDVEVADESWAVGSELFLRTTVWAKGALP
jgi:hypothetical protein